MRGVMLLSLSILLPIVAAHGCATPQSPLERTAADRAFLEKEIRAYAERLVAQANTEAAKLDGQVRVEMCDERWVVFFEPTPKPEPRPESPAAGGDDRIPQYQQPVVVKEKRKITLVPPATALRREWTDRYALAQTFEYRWSLAEIGPIQLRLDEKTPCEAEVTFTMHVTRSSAIASDVRPLPSPPEGMKLWRPHGLDFFGVGGGRGGADRLPGRTLPGRSVDEVADDVVAQQALRGLALTDNQKESASLKCRVFYNALTRGWNMVYQEPLESPPAPGHARHHVKDREDEGALPAARYPEKRSDNGQLE